MRPTELIRSRRPAAPLLLELDLTRGVLEAPASTPLDAVRTRHTPVLRTVVEALRKASTDDRVVGLVAHVGVQQPTLSQSEELRAAVADFRRSGKATVCWSESYGEMGPGNVAYHLASAFEQVWLQQSGEVGLIGVVAEAVFVRDALDKLGIDPQIGQRHEYKTAANMFLESSMTEAHREMAERLVESAMDTIVSDVAASRGLEEAAVRAAVDQAPLMATDAVERRLVDQLGYRDEVYADLRARLGDVELRFVERYGKGLAALAGSTPPLARRTKPVVAVIQASGPIHLGRSGRSPLAGPSIGSDSLGAALRAAGADDDVKAVVLRVDSPGGSHLASDAIHREVLTLRRTGRPVVASMASVAGSGGYFIAMPADVVVAGAGTLTGSIGVLAGKQVTRAALSRIGIERDSVAVGANAEMFSSQRPFTAEEWQRMEDSLDRIYADFTGKAAADRDMPVAALREVAKGRVWTGADAADRGLVDELGGLSHAIDVACDRARLRRSAVEVRMVPKHHLLERLRPADNSEHPAAATLVGGPGLLPALLSTLGLPPYGVLTMPVTWRLS
ncbi:MAG: signal peptide peptidase SppA [Propionibacteriales bacterium]|nr:signal peptide peptidase SppA [Propionibacteriales bacterium]